MEAVVFVFSLLDCCALIFLSVYFVSLPEAGGSLAGGLRVGQLGTQAARPEAPGPALPEPHPPSGEKGRRFSGRGPLPCFRRWVIPELIGHTIVTVLMLISLHWFIFLLNLPVATWNIYRYIMVPSGNMGVFDPTEIHNRGQLKSHMKEAMIKLGFHLLCFFMYLYSMILALIND
ncbi:protein cornichon homolog 4 isoform X1 [Rhinopithecus roxellana]|uniref:protein cornichon homolog 4 isoform X1 n=1 Tax=Rhinopithecus roxellana TaxID=61622 RepID=UPI0012373820|nr:protein cornichon homolog 4 isoform X1 [Rhinopithecus roxellana]